MNFSALAAIKTKPVKPGFFLFIKSKSINEINANPPLNKYDSRNRLSFEAKAKKFS